MNHVDIKVITLSSIQCWIRSGYHASMSAILEAKNYVKKLLFSIAFLNRNVFEQLSTTDSNKCHDVQYGVTRVQCETEEKQPNGISTCDLLTAEVIRVVYSVYEDWVISSWVDMRDMDMRNWFATVWSIYFIIMYQSNRSFNIPPRAYLGHLTSFPAREEGIWLT